MTVYPGHIELRTYEPTDLEEQGYSYEYLSPENLKLPSAKVVNRILAPDAQAFKVMVVRANDSLTIEGASKLVEFARAGLPIIFAGGVPSTFLGTNPPALLRTAKESLHATVSLPNVHTTSTYLVASSIAELGIKPSTKISANASWFTYWRSDVKSGIDYIFVYNDAMYEPLGGGLSEGTIEFESTGIPYEYNAWTGEVRPILSYSQDNSTTTISLRLAGNQSTIVAFHPTSMGVKRSTHLTKISAGIVDVYSSDNNTLTLKIGGTEPISYTTASGLQRNISAISSRPFTISNWSLIVEHWDPPPNLYSYTYGAYKHNSTHQLSDMVSWLEIPDLRNVSGRGYYHAAFNWPPSSTNSTPPSGAILHFPPITHTLRASLNGHLLPPLDVSDPKADIQEYLVRGQNIIEVVVATPLGNAMRPIWHMLMSSGESPSSPDAGERYGFVPPPEGRYGMFGGKGVFLLPYQEIVI